MKKSDEVKKGLGEYFNLDEVERHIQCCIDTEECILCSFFREGCDKSTFAKLMREAVRWLKAQVPKQISVEDRLPEEGQNVLVSVGRSIGISNIICHDMVTGEPIWTYTGLGADPEYWMPLPETEEK